MAIQLKTISLMLTSALLFAACASAPKIDPRMTALENKLAALVSNPDLASRGGDALKAAESAVRRAGTTTRQTSDREIDYNFYAADRLIQTAEMSARIRLAEDRRNDLVREQEKLVLEARTLEAKMALAQAEQAKQSAAEAMALREKALLEAANAEKMRDSAQLASAEAVEKQRKAESAAAMALSEAESARLLAVAESERAAMAAQKAAEEAEKAAVARAEADAARSEMDSLRNRLSELEAKQTERGLLITLGDVLFEFNKSDLKPGVARNLEPLAAALTERVDQTVIIEGHTDSVGSHEYNLALSRKRAEAVEAYLLGKGIDGSRLTIAGLGPDFPLADNNSESGRQKNRRVEVILPNLK